MSEALARKLARPPSAGAQPVGARVGSLLVSPFAERGMSVRPDPRWLEGRIADERLEQLRLRRTGQRDAADRKQYVIDLLLERYAAARRLVTPAG